MSQELSTTDSSAQNKRSPWPFIVAGLLATHVGAMMLAVQLASGDSGHAVLPDYYDRAVRWDELREEQAQSDELGWTMTATPAALAGPDGLRELRLVFSNSAGAPVEDLAVAVRIFHDAVAQPLDALAQASDVPGLYVARLPLDRAGAWQLEVRATRGGGASVETFVELQKLFLADATAAEPREREDEAS